MEINRWYIVLDYPDLVVEAVDGLLCTPLGPTYPNGPSSCWFPEVWDTFGLWDDEVRPATPEEVEEKYWKRLNIEGATGE